ncbi:MAG: insulinase family protein [Ignavibacteriaceae bacterium]|nr:insulinase family protein [Ignavibacteriaceae bacterium]
MNESFSKESKFFPFKTHEVVLENGFKAILIPVGNSGLVSYYSVVRTGSRDEWEEGKSGFAHFFEHMMFRGTDRFPGNVYDSIITSIGANANAYTSDDLTVYHLNFASEDLALVMDLESDRFRNLKYSKEQFQTESGAVYGEYRKGRTSPWSVAFEELRDMAFDKHTYKHTTIGFERDIKDMPNLYEYSISFYNRYYRPENVTLVIVGDFDIEKTKKIIGEYYKPWKPGYVMPKIEKEPAQKAPRFKEVQYDGKTLPLVIMGFKTDEFRATDKNFISTVSFADLAFGETSEIYKKLVLKEQKVQFISASPGMNRDPYMFEIYTMIKDEKDIDYVIGEINNTIEQFKKEKVTVEKLDRLKKNKKYSFLMALDSPDAVASILPQYITLANSIEVIDQMSETMMNLTPDDIVKSVNLYFTENNRNTIVLKGTK